MTKGKHYAGKSQGTLDTVSKAHNMCDQRLQPVDMDKQGVELTSTCMLCQQ